MKRKIEGIHIVMASIIMLLLLNIAFIADTITLITFFRMVMNLGIFAGLIMFFAKIAPP